MSDVRREVRIASEDSRPVYEPLTITVSRQDVLRYAAAVGVDLDGLELDSKGEPIPPVTFYFSLGMMRGRLVNRWNLDRDGLPYEDGMGGRITAGKTEVVIEAPLAVGDEVTVTQALIAAEEKSGRSGALTLHTLERRYVRADGVLAVRERYTRILR